MTTYKEINKNIRKLPLKQMEARNRPCFVKDYDYLIGTASEIWMFIQFLPIIVECVSNPYLKMLLLLRRLCEFIFAPAVHAYQISEMNSFIGEYI